MSPPALQSSQLFGLVYLLETPAACHLHYDEQVCRLSDLSCRPSPTGDWEATTSPALVSPSLLLCLTAARAAAGKATRPQGRRRRGFVLALRHGRGTCSGAAEPARSDLAVEQPAAGLSGVAAVSGGGGSGVKALAAAEETARSAPGSGRTAAGGEDSDGGKGGEGMASVRSSARRSGGRDGGGDEFTATAARATTAGRLRRVSSELDDGDKVWEDDEMAAGMEGQQRLLWWRRRWQGDGVGEVNLAATAADPAPEESSGRGDGGDEFAATAARATTMGSLRRKPARQGRVVK
uniref:Uncharacterized protein n=1 Tax=Oryza rufipogon TaxID=4529 RepID=A0A0E0N437_ORYRU